MKNIKQENENYYYSLNILKILLAIIIVFHHYQQCIDGNYKYELINFFDIDGKINCAIACEMFFIISGFLAAIKLPNANMKFKEYFGHKVIRLYPMAIISTVGFMAVMTIYRIFTGECFLGIAPGFWRILNSFFLTYCGWMVCNISLGINNPLWFVGVLLLCYMWLYVICFLSHKLDIDSLYPCIVMSLVGLAGMQYFCDFPFLNAYSSRGYAAFFLGVVLHRIYARSNRQHLALVSLVVIIAVICGGMLDFSMFFDYTWGILTYIFFPCVLFVTLYYGRNINNRMLKILGNISFEIYIWHLSFIIILITISKVTGSINIYSNLSMIFFALFMVAIGTLMYFYVELPVNRKIKRYLVGDSI